MNSPTGNAPSSTSLAAALMSVSQREYAGARSANRFAYQRSWTLCHMLKLHESGSDYVIIAEFHDDVAVLDSASNPTQIEFYQIKTAPAGKRWTLNALLKQKSAKGGGKLPSILGKMYTCLLEFLPYVSRLSFVSNAPCRLTRADGTSSENHVTTTFDLLENSELDRIRAGITKEHGLSTFPGGEAYTCVELAHLPVQEHDVTALGRTTEFLEKTPTYRHVPPSAFHRTLSGEIERRCTRESHPSGIVELVSKHGISRNEFVQMLASAAACSAGHPLVGRIEARLNAENCDVAFVRDVVAGAARYTVERMDPRQLILNEAALEARSLAVSLQSGRLTDMLSEVRSVSDGALRKLVTARGLRYAQAVLAVAIYETLSDDELPSTRSTDQDEAT